MKHSRPLAQCGTAQFPFSLNKGILFSGVTVKRSSKGNFGYVKCARMEDAERAVQAMDGTLLGRFNVQVSLAHYNKPFNPGKCLETCPWRSLWVGISLAGLRLPSIVAMPPACKLG